MKAATGELNLTIITIIAIGAVLAFFWLLWPTIQGNISDGWDNTQTTGYIETDYNSFV
jgi:hypothetical protein